MDEQQTHQEVPSRMRARRWYVWDVLLTTAASLGSPHFFPALGYFDGLRNDLSLAGVYVICMVWPLLGVGLIVLAIRMIFTWPKHIRGKRRLWSFRLATTAGFIVLFVLPFTSLRLPGLPGFIEGFRRYARSHVDVSAIQAWLSTVDPNHCTGEYVTLDGRGGEQPARLDAVVWPEAVTRLDLHYARLMKTEADRPKIRLIWGGGFIGQRGVEIGPADMPIPESVPPYKTDLGGRVFWEEGEERLPLAPGAYVWQEIQ